MKPLLFALTLSALALGSSGCATLDNPAARGAAEAGLAAAELAAPQYASALRQVRGYLKGESADPVQAAVAAGFVYERVWYYEGKVVPESSIAFVDLLRRSSGPGETAAAVAAMADPERDRVVAEIDRLLEAVEVEQ